MIKEELAARLRKLGQREEVIQNLLKDKAKVSKVLGMLLKTGVRIKIFEFCTLLTVRTLSGGKF